MEIRGSNNNGSISFDLMMNVVVTASVTLVKVVNHFIKLGFRLKQTKVGRLSNLSTDSNKVRFCLSLMFTGKKYFIGKHLLKNHINLNFGGLRLGFRTLIKVAIFAS